MAKTTAFDFDNSYARELPDFYARCNPTPARKPGLLFLNHPLAKELRIDLSAFDELALSALFSGNTLPEGADPIAQAYAGHQFGNFSAQLGDGRALLLGEVIDNHGKRRDIALKGSGRTPFSRSGDGKAAIGPMLREVLMGEYMHAIGIPTTRALAVTSTGEAVYRETTLPGAVLTRVAASHIRVGTFEYFAARGESDRVQQLLEYTLARHDSDLSETPDRYINFLKSVARRQAVLVAQWMGVGFIHGVMNTDNMSIAGETIDFGPCAFMENYHPNTVFSSIDAMGRYAYKNQPKIAQWNLARLAETLLPLLSDNHQTAIDLATEVITDFPHIYQQQWLQVMRTKLGLKAWAAVKDHDDNTLAEDWLALLEKNQVDFTVAWRSLAEAADGQYANVQTLFADQSVLNEWLSRWRTRCAAEDSAAGSPLAAPSRSERIRRANPWMIPRNHRVEEALTAASEEGNLEPFHALLAALKRPFDEKPKFAHYAEPAPTTFTASYQTFCGT